jgi:predicted component of type VI protein secretion system
VREHTYSIGRSPDCDVVLADQSVSRKHAELVVLDGGQLFLVDCQSTHGTTLMHGGTTRPVRQEFLEPDAVVTFGDVAMPVRDLLDAVRSRHPGAKLPARASSSDMPVRRGNTWARGTRLVRCRCGVVKAKGQRCPECGE